VAEPEIRGDSLCRAHRQPRCAVRPRPAAREGERAGVGVGVGADGQVHRVPEEMRGRDGREEPRSGISPPISPCISPYLAAETDARSLSSEAGLRSVMTQRVTRGSCLIKQLRN